MRPHRWRIGDALRTTYGYVGTVTDRTVYGVTLDHRIFMSQTLIKEKLSAEEAAREIRHIRDDRKTQAQSGAEGSGPREKLRDVRNEARSARRAGRGRAKQLGLFD